VRREKCGEEKRSKKSGVGSGAMMAPQWQLKAPRRAFRAWGVREWGEKSKMP